MEENKDTQVIASLQDVKDMFTLQTTLNALLDKYEITFKMLEESNKTNVKLNEQIMKLIEENTKLIEANNALVSRASTLCDNVELAKWKNTAIKLDKDNKDLRKQLDELKRNGAPSSDEATSVEETTTDEKPKKGRKSKTVEASETIEEPVEVKSTGNKVKPTKIEGRYVIPENIVNDAKKIVAKYNTSAYLKKRLCRRDDLKGEFKDRDYLFKLYDYLKDIGFVDNAGVIKSRNVEFKR